MRHSTEILTFFDVVLNEKKCSELARQYQFIKRSSSKLKGSEFIKTMIIPSEGLSMDNLKGLCLRIREFNSEANLSAQALCERINDVSAKKLMKGVYASILAYIHANLTNNFPQLHSLEKFNSIYLEDSTVIKLHENLQKIFKGTNRGGTGAKSQVKIDLIYDLMQGSIVNAEIYHGNEPDQGLAERIIRFIKTGDLVIRDLGYFVLKTLKMISDSEAFFLSRLPPHVKVYLNKNDLDAIDLGKHLEKYYSLSSIIDLTEVFIGDEKIPTRLVLYRLPKNVVEAKLREANKRAKATGRIMSRGKKLLMQYAAFVTNVSVELLTAEVIGTVYRLRWEIELVFKRWKDQLKIDYLKGISRNRIECLIWSRLCSILIIEMVNRLLERIVRKLSYGIELSNKKVIDYLLRQNRFCASIARNCLQDLLEEMERDLCRMLLKDKRKRKTMREKVMTLESYYEMQPFGPQRVA